MIASTAVKVKEIAMSKLTPGPWYRRGDNHMFGYTIAAAGSQPGTHLIIAEVVGIDPVFSSCNRYTVDETTEANARLIAASPTMLEALKTVLPILQKLDTLRHLGAEFSGLALVEAAIALATGETT